MISYETQLTFAFDHQLTQQQREEMELCIYNKIQELVKTSSFDVEWCWQEFIHGK